MIKESDGEFLPFELYSYLKEKPPLGTIILGIIGDDQRKQERMFDL